MCVCSIFDISCSYLRKEKIGQGTYGKVYKGINLNTEKVIALKRVCFNDTYGPHEGVPSTTLREVAILKSLRHPNIVRYVHILTRLFFLFVYNDYVHILSLSLSLSIRYRRRSSRMGRNAHGTRVSPPT